MKILRLSSSVTSSISTPVFFRRLSDSLEKTGKAVTKLNLLRITRVVCEHHPDRQTLVERFGLAETIERLAKQDEAVLVRELAKEVIPILLFGNTTSSSTQEDEEGRIGQSYLGGQVGSAALGIMSQRGSGSGMRRTTSETTIITSSSTRPPVSTAMTSGPSVASGLSGVGKDGSTQRLQRDRNRPVSVLEGKSLGVVGSQVTARLSSLSSSSSTSGMSSPSVVGERPKHKRRISRSQLR